MLIGGKTVSSLDGMAAELGGVPCCRMLTRIGEPRALPAIMLGDTCVHSSR